MTSQNGSLKEAHFRLYDRQIRLWGLEAQKRLTQASVLIIGFNGCAAEIAKNILLAGVNYVCIADDKLNDDQYEKVVENFMLLPKDESSLINRIQSYFRSLNSLVQFQVRTDIPEDFSAFNIVCMCKNASLTEVNDVNKKCRSYNVNFLHSWVQGYFGSVFCDFGDLYKYSKKTKLSSDADVKQKQNSDKQTYEDSSKTFSSLDEALSRQDSKNISKIKIQRTSIAYFIYLVFNEFFKQFNRLPNETDCVELDKLYSEIRPNDSSINWKQCFIDYLPTSIVLGGIICQEITKMSSISDLLNLKRKNFKLSQLELDLNKNWDKFYSRNGDRFFKDRHWIEHELDLSTCTSFIELGCGVGNLIFPLAQQYPLINVYGCDFSQTAIDLLNVRLRQSRQIQNVKVVRADITDNNLTELLPQGDVVSLVYVLSSISKRKRVLKNASKLLRNNSSVLFIRDYAKLDLADLRFSQNEHLKTNEMVFRQDGTGSYFFSEKEMKDMVEDIGLCIIDCRTISQEVTNIKEEKHMNRRYIQIKATLK